MSRFSYKRLTDTIKFLIYFHKGILFDKIYIDAVRCVLSNNDFHEFHCSEEEMVAGIVDEGAKAMRLGLGILM